MTLGIHLSSELAPLLVLGLAILVDEQSHGLYGEGQQGLGTLLVEPLHEALLQPRETVPVGLAAIGEVELAENRLEIVAIVVGHIPEHSLVVAGTCGLVQGVDNLLEVIGDNLVDATFLQGKVSLLVGMLPVVLAVLITDEVVHIHEELGGCAGTGEHGADHEHHVDETTGKRLQVGRSRRVATNGRRTTDQPWVHGDRSTVVGQRGLVILIYKVVSQQVDILVGQLLVIHLLDALSKQTTVQTDEVRLGQLANQRSNVLMLHIGVGIKLRTGSGISRLHIVGQELQLSQRLTILGVLLAIKHE